MATTVNPNPELDQLTILGDQKETCSRQSLLFSAAYMACLVSAGLRGEGGPTQGC